MLKNPRIGVSDPSIERVLTAIGQGGKPTELEPGIYLTNSFSFGHNILQPHESYPELGDLGPYGVCDNVDQVKKVYADYLNDPFRSFCISLTKVSKAEQSPSGGWRWHKWGDYIGDKNPQCEYLYDEGPEIEEVYCFHIYELI